MLLQFVLCFKKYFSLLSVNNTLKDVTKLRLIQFYNFFFLRVRIELTTIEFTDKLFIYQFVNIPIKGLLSTKSYSSLFPTKKLPTMRPLCVFFLKKITVKCESDSTESTTYKSLQTQFQDNGIYILCNMRPKTKQIRQYLLIT